MRSIRAVIVTVVVAGSSVLPVAATGAAGGTRCEPTEGRVVVDGFVPVVGRGPAYAAGLHKNPVPFGRPGDTWGVAKLLWIGDPAYSGDVVIRGRRIDAPGPVRLGPGHHRELRLSTADSAHGSWAGSSLGWRDWPSSVRVKTSGCYELTVRTSKGVDRVVFRAERRER
jgi:hypothetical protein